MTFPAPLDGLSLSRSAVDRAADRRSDPDLLKRLLAEPSTPVLALVGGTAPVAPDLSRLELLPASSVPDAEPPVLAYLGRSAGGQDHLGMLWPAGEVPELGLPDGTRWAGLRELGAVLDDRDTGLLTTAVALGGWHASHPRCARCGHPTDVAQAGWQRHCPECGADHYPRTDPAVIMAVESADGRLLLGRQATWPEKRFSTLAGFVEPGESLEAAVRREVAEEAAVAVGQVTYRGSQPWPFPSSLMLGFRAVATSTDIRVDGDELAEARWWTPAELVADLEAGEVLLPPRVSIARRLIEDWYGAELPGGEAWR